FLPNRNPIVNHSGVYYSTNRGENWCGIGPDTYVEELLAVGDTVFATNQAMYKSSDRGEGWFFTSLGLIDSLDDQSGQYQLAITPSGALLAGNRFIYRSLDFGRTWVTVYTTTNTNHLIQCFGVSPSGVVLAGSQIDLATMSYWLRRSLNSGENWQLTVQLPNPPKSILWLSGSSWLIGLQNGLYRTDDDGLTIAQIHPTMDIETLVRSGNGTIYSGDWGGYVRRSTDNGATWVTANEPLATATVIYSLLILQNGDILAGTSRAGIFRSIDQGNSWTAQNTGLGSTRVYSLVQTNDGVIYAGTEQGIYRCDNFSRINEPLGSVQLPTRATLAPAFPNPFNATTTIGYSLPTASYVQVDVVDLLGRTVTQLVREHQTAGSHSIRFTGKDIASGIYFVRLQTGSKTVTQKIVLLR
ncbi:MAG: T9SS type A sorting domain-containing protein, partial [bacterium]|nr:T9SS type A sorting domain-containing protein [bacterium]